MGNVESRQAGAAWLLLLIAGAFHHVRADTTLQEVTAVELEASELIREAKAKVAAEEARIKGHAT